MDEELIKINELKEQKIKEMYFELEIRFKAMFKAKSKGKSRKEIEIIRKEIDEKHEFAKVTFLKYFNIHVYGNENGIEIEEYE